MKTIMKLLRKIEPTDIVVIALFIVVIFVADYADTRQSYRMSDVQNMRIKNDENRLFFLK